MKFYKALLILIIFLSFFLRFYKISENPPGLYIDEVDIGLNAYKILTTGRDEFGKPFPLFFKSFGDYKMPTYVYLTSGSIFLFGRNELAVRFPSALFGSLTILVFYFFVKKLMEFDEDVGKAKREKIALLSSFLLAITPWHIHFSRGGFEATVALFFFLMGLVLFLYFFKNKKNLFLIFSLLMFALTIYTYHAYRVIAPLTIIFLGILYLLNFPKNKKKAIIALCSFGILILPVIIFSFSPEGSARFSQTSAFSEVHVNSLFEKLFTYPFTLLKNYLSFFSFNFLFDTGDGIGRHQIHNLGPLYKWELPFLLIGIFALFKLKNKFIKWITFFLVLVSPLAASLAVPSPHTLRSLPLVIPLTFITALGLYFLFEHLHKFKKLIIFLICVVMIYEFSLYMHFYYVHYPKVNGLDWGGGYKELVTQTNEIGKNYDLIVFDNHFELAPLYYKFYIGDNSPKIVGLDWEEPTAFKNKKILYVRPFYGPNTDKNIIKEVRLPNDNSYIFAQFWSL